MTVLLFRKHGRPTFAGKIVRHNGRTILAIPFKNRPIHTPSFPIGVLAYARMQNVDAIVIRFDRGRRCYEISFNEALAIARQEEDGEWYVPINRFKPCEWIDWDYSTRTVLVDG